MDTQWKKKKKKLYREENTAKLIKKETEQTKENKWRERMKSRVSSAMHRVQKHDIRKICDNSKGS